MGNNTVRLATADCLGTQSTKGDTAENLPAAVTLFLALSASVMPKQCSCTGAGYGSLY